MTKRSERIAFTTEDHDDSHTVKDNRDWAGPFQICLTCLHTQLDDLPPTPRRTS